MNSHSRFEAKSASALVGVVMVLLGFLIAAPSDEPLHRILDARGRADDWGFIMILLGCMTVYGSVRPKRNCRQIGLALDAFFLLSLFGVMMVNWGLSFSTLLLFVFGVAAVVLLAADVAIYRRDLYPRDHVQGH